jgi:hypothetical protein
VSHYAHFIALTRIVLIATSANQLTVLAPEIGNMTSLRSLYLGRNKLIALPAELGMLTGKIHYQRHAHAHDQ